MRAHSALGSVSGGNTVAFYMPSAWDFFLCCASWHNGKEMFEFSAMANHRLFRIFSMCHIDLLFQTYFQKNIFPAFKCWIKTWNGFWFWLQLSKLQKPINCMTVWPIYSCLCPSLCWACPFLRKQSHWVSFRCFYSSLVCSYSCEFAKLLHPILNWLGSQKCPW